jgi:hypothetical protein
MANREQKGKPKKEKPKDSPVSSSLGVQINKPAGKRK